MACWGVKYVCCGFLLLLDMADMYEGCLVYGRLWSEQR